MNQPTTAMTVFEGHIEDPKINTDFWERARKSDPSTWDLSHLIVLEEKGKACIRIEDMSKIVHETEATVANELMYITSAYNDTRNEFYYFTDVIPEEHGRRIARLNRDMCLRYVMVKCKEPNVGVMLRFAEAFDKVESAIAAKRALGVAEEKSAPAPEVDQRTFEPVAVAATPEPEPEQVQAEAVEQDAPDLGSDEVLVWDKDGQAVTSSRNVAAVFGKEHKNVLKDIERVIGQLPKEQSSDLSSGLFIGSVYKNDPNGRAYPEYLITRDGLTLLVMGYTGPKAMAFKLAYIRRFNEMERALAKQHEAQVSDAAMRAHSAQCTLEHVTALPNPNRYLIPTELGMLVGLEPWEVNQRLKFLGYQYHTDFGWRLTTKGKALGAVCVNTGKRDDEGNAILQIKWPAYVTEVL
ncbi:MAG TPA: Rha family transcriptional regulator [Candidatus Anaerobiospirillum pullistercoris]|uniref:Rha family transcriptional regulator n=1 Tax=Candidatus Anaerobiospirillum pullistercoris TaxID=2838452 RepID=A0A9D1WCS9_9GAMM|nr:Rha family transcriptional regulator [Candidatus Anaerobiospirillum pullistercoris]